jgi:hydroxymethylpyrimidine/phosphomethylpyrimidine kinase
VVSPDAVPGDPPVGMTIAGSDSGAGAGIQADIKTMGALGVFATTVLTSVTAQSTSEVREVHPLPVELVEAQMATVLDDLPVRAVKTGLLGAPDVIRAVGRRAADGDLPHLVVDPVMVASTGRIFVVEDGIDAYRRDLLPQALITTPNLWEAALLADRAPTGVEDVEAMAELARRIYELGPAWVLVKGPSWSGTSRPDPGPETDTPAGCCRGAPGMTVTGPLGPATPPHPSGSFRLNWSRHPSSGRATTARPCPGIVKHHHPKVNIR